MSRKVLADRKHTTILQPFGVGNNLVRHIERTFTEGTGIDNRILGIDIHIRYGSKIHLHPQFTALAGHLAPIFINQCIVLYAAQHHVRGKFGVPRRRIASPHSPSKVIISGTSAIRCASLVNITWFCINRRRITDRLPYSPPPPYAAVPCWPCPAGGNRIDEQLSDAFFQSQTLHDGIHPLPAPHVTVQETYKRRVVRRHRSKRHRAKLRFQKRTKTTQYSDIGKQVYSLHSL